MPRQAALVMRLYALALLSISAFAVPAAKRDRAGALVPEKPQAVLVPIVLNGPNNQKRDMRNYAAMARQLEMTLALPGMFKHYLDRKAHVWHSRHQLSVPSKSDTPELPTCFPDTGKLGYMPFDMVYDRRPFDAMLPTATFDELREQGWNGQLDAIVLDDQAGIWENNMRYINRMFQAENMTLPYNAPRILFKTPMKCNPRTVASLKEQIKDYKYVGMVKLLIGNHMNPKLKEESRWDANQLTGCAKHLAQATRTVRPAPWIRDMARKFTQEKFNGTSYLAVHVRPYPDHCLTAWQSGDAIPGKALSDSLCANDLTTLHDKVGPCAARIAKAAGISKVFVMSHPVILPQVRDLLQQAGFEDMVSVQPADLLKLAKCQDQSFSFLSMVEEEIAAQADQFLGTHHSSITQSLVYSRYGLGKLDSNNYFEDMKC